MNFFQPIYRAGLALGFACVSIANAEETINSALSAPLPKSENAIRGQLKARQFTVLAAGIAGQLTSFPITEGQRLDKGQTIAVFNCRMKTAEKEVAAAKLSAAQSKLKANSQLAEYKNISGLELTLSKAEVAISQAELNKANAALSECSIAAPFSAVVARKMAQAYQYVKEGDPLVELVDTSNLEVEMVIPSTWLQKFSSGSRFSLVLDEIPSPVEAKIDRNVGNIDPVSQTIRVIGALINPPSALLPGMSGEVRFNPTNSSEKNTP